MYLHLPIEQLMRRRDSRFQHGFAAQAKKLLPEDDDFALLACSDGLRVLARNEDELATPVEVLRDAYGERLEVEAPRVRLIEGVRVQEPIMHVRVSLEVKYLDAVKRAMQARAAVPEEEYVRSTYAVLRFEAPLAGLLGLPRELAALTAHTAKHWIVLSHYAPVSGDPGGSAA